MMKYFNVVLMFSTCSIYESNLQPVNKTSNEKQVKM
jgi:hypothetical protein